MIVAQSSSFLPPDQNPLTPNWITHVNKKMNQKSYRANFHPARTRNSSSRPWEFDIRHNKTSIKKEKRKKFGRQVCNVRNLLCSITLCYVNTNPLHTNQVCLGIFRCMTRPGALHVTHCDLVRGLCACRGTQGASGAPGHELSMVGRDRKGRSVMQGVPRRIDQCN